jgi:hypothetical protein
MALPALESRTFTSDPSFAVLNGGGQAAFSELATMDRVVQTEFQKRFPGIVTRALTSSVLKALAQNELNKNSQPLVGLLGNIATAASTAADVRMWRSMPSRFMLARMSLNGDRAVTLEYQGGSEAVQLPESGSAIIHIKQLDSTTKPSFEVMRI